MFLFLLRVRGFIDSWIVEQYGIDESKEGFFEVFVVFVSDDVDFFGDFLGGFGSEGLFEFEVGEVEFLEEGGGVVVVLCVEDVFVDWGIRREMLLDYVET